MRSALTLLLATLVVWIAAYFISGAVAAPDPLTCQGYPESRVFLESQSWHADLGKPAASVQLATCFPLLQTLSGPSVHFDVRGRFTGNPGVVKGLRVQIFKNGADPTYAQKFDWTCATDCERWFSIDVPLSALVWDGRWEFRMTFNVPKTADGDRQFNTTRWHAVIANGKPVKNASESIDRMGAAGWYTLAGYTNVRLNHEDGLLAFFGRPSGVWRPRVFFERTSGRATVDGATVVYSGPGGKVWRTLAIDTSTLAPGRHTLELSTSVTTAEGVSRGVFVIPFMVG